MSSGEKEEIKLVKEYLSRCPTVPQTSKAIRISMAALDQELRRIERDEKLRRKFSKDVSESKRDIKAVLSDDSLVMVRAEDDLASSAKKNTKQITNTNETWGCESDWQTIHSADENDCNADQISNEQTMELQGKSSSGEAQVQATFGYILAQAAITDMSRANTTVTTPLAALALILHSALRSKILDFKCTGVPEKGCFDEQGNNKGGTKKKKINGFAAPVRELPRGVFVPSKWDEHASKNLQNDVNGGNYVTFRYSKIGMPTTALRVQMGKGSEDSTMELDTSSSGSSNVPVLLKFGPLSGEPTQITFWMEQHINIPGLQKALEANNRIGGGVKPALFFKDLPGLMTDFTQKMDLGNVNLPSNENGSTGRSMESLAAPYVQSKIPPPPVYIGGRRTNASAMVPNNIPGAPPTIQDDLLATRTGRNIMPPTGDFSGDLLPSGLPAPGFADPLNRIGSDNGSMTGNLMGPNHPAFQRDFDDDLNGNGNHFGGMPMPTPGGLGMQPRFDPFYPPGVGGMGLPGRGGRGRGRGRGRGGRGSFSGGDPNPDHLRPPNSFNDSNMFM